MHIHTQAHTRVCPLIHVYVCISVLHMELGSYTGNSEAELSEVGIVRQPGAARENQGAPMNKSFSAHSPLGARKTHLGPSALQGSWTVRVV